MKRITLGVSALIQHQGKFLLVQRKKAPSALQWALPGGAVELGESLEDACVREVMEETHVACTLQDRRPLRVTEVVEPSYGHFVLLTYKATLTNDDDMSNVVSGDDALRARFVSVEEMELLDMNADTMDIIKEFSAGAFD